MNFSLKRQQKAKSSISDVWEGSEYASDTDSSNIVILNFKPYLENVKTFAYFVYIKQNSPNNRKYVHSAA